MTSDRSRSTFLLVLLALGVCNAWLAWRWAETGGETDAAQQQLEECESLARQIERLRLAPIRVDERVHSGDTMSRLVEAAAGDVGLGSEHIVQIAPEEPRRLGDSPYQEQVTEVDLRQLTLRQLIELSLALGRRAPDIHLPDITLRTAPGEAQRTGPPETWNVQLVLTAHIYAPKIPASK